MAKKNNFDNVLSDIISDTRDTAFDETLVSTASEAAIKKPASIRKQIDPNLLLPNPKNRFSMEKDSEYEILKASIEKTGSINNDIIVTPIEGDTSHFRIVSGHRRTAIAKELGIPKVWIKILSFDNEIDETIFVIQENIGTRQKKPLDIAMSIKELESLLTNTSGRKRDAIAEMLGISSKSVYNYSVLIDLPDAVIDWLNKELINTTQAITIAGIGEENIQALILAVENKAGEGVTDSELKDFLKQAIRTFSKPAKPIDRVKLPKADKSIKKVLACLTPLQSEFVLPKSKKKKDELKEQIRTAITFLEELEGKIKEQN